MDSQQSTQPTLATILEAVNNMRQELAARIDQVEQKFDARFEAMRLEMMSFDVRVDRIEANSYEMLSIVKNARADVKVLREEVYAWSKDVRVLMDAA